MSLAKISGAKSSRRRIVCWLRGATGVLAATSCVEISIFDVTTKYITAAYDVVDASQKLCQMPNEALYSVRKIRSAGEKLYVVKLVRFKKLFAA